MRTAQALRELAAISLAFREGHLSYTKVRALTRVAALHDEDALLRYALDATAPQVEERCRQIRNVQPDSVHEARRTWDARSLSVCCHRTRFVDAHHVHHWAAGGETSIDNLVLLCSHHHRLLHEGGYRIRRDYRGAWYFVRADGRAISRCGYRAEDRADSADGALESPSTEGSYTMGSGRPNPSMEVRDGGGVYRLRRERAELRA